MGDPQRRHPAGRLQGLTTDMTGHRLGEERDAVLFTAPASTGASSGLSQKPRSDQRL